MLKNNIKDLTYHIEQSLEYGKLEVSKLTQDIFNIPGLTSNKVRCFLNNICTIKNMCYLIHLSIYFYKLNQIPFLFFHLKIKNQH